MSTFTEDLQKLGVELSSHEIPSSTELPGVVGAIVKVLEASGATVADDLFPKAPEPEPVPGAPAPAPAASGSAEQENVLGKVLDALKSLEGRISQVENKGDQPAAGS